MKNFYSSFLVMILLITISSKGFGQTNTDLEFSWINSWNFGTGPVVGPTIAPQTQTFFQDLSDFTSATTPDFASFSTPTVTVTTALQNQTYTGLNYGNVSTGLSFGTSKKEWGSTEGTSTSQMANPNILYDILGGGTGTNFGPKANMFKAQPTAILSTIDPDQTQGGSDANGGVALFTTVEPLQDLGLSKSGRYLYGQLVITFSKAVQNPVIHLASLGGYSFYQPTGSTNWLYSYFSTELELVTANGPSTTNGVNTVSTVMLSGNANFNIVGNNILNSATKQNAFSIAGFNDPTGVTQAAGAASGSIEIVGTVTTLVYNVFLNGNAASDFNFSFDKSAVTGGIRDPFYGDYWSISYSLPITNTILAVQLIDFTATPQNNTSLLNWIVGKEFAVSKYQVEHSIDGVFFTSIGNATATGKSNYSFVDNSPANGLNYYRLKTINDDGTFSYSPIRVVNFSISDSKVTIYPNPASGKVNVSVSGEMVNKSATIMIRSMDGKTVYSQYFGLLSQIQTIDVSKYPSGQYMVSIVSDNKIVNSALQIIK